MHFCILSAEHLLIWAACVNQVVFQQHFVVILQICMQPMTCKAVVFALVR